MQSVASPKLAQTAQTAGQSGGSNMNPQAAQEAHALANASETLKAQAQTLKVSSVVPDVPFTNGCLTVRHHASVFAQLFCLSVHA